MEEIGIFVIPFTMTDAMSESSITHSGGCTFGNVLIRKKRKRFSFASEWKHRYIALQGSVLSTFSSKSSYDAQQETSKHTINLSSSCTCAPHTESADSFILKMSQDDGLNDVGGNPTESFIICKVFNRKECHEWISAIGRAIHYSIDSRAAEEILQRHPTSSSPRSTTFKNEQGKFDPSSLNSLLRRKSLSTLETSAIRNLMMSLKNDQNIAATKGGEHAEMTNPALDAMPHGENVWYAAFPFSASNDEQLSLERGEVVIVIENDDLQYPILPLNSVQQDTNKVKVMHLQNEHGWVIVENQQQQQGRVPFGFLTQDSSEIRKNDDAVTSSSLGNEMRISLYEYTATSDQELTFGAGEQMHIVERHANGWWLARHSTSGQVGFVPSNFFVADRLMEMEETNTTVSGAMERKRRNSRVLFDYSARSTNEVTVKEGDMIVIVEDDPSLEWTMVEVRGQRGYIPTAYLKRLAVETAVDQETSTNTSNNKNTASKEDTMQNIKNDTNNKNDKNENGIEAENENENNKDRGLTASVLGWQSSVARMPTSVQGLLQKKNLSASEIVRVQEMMTMLSTTPPTIQKKQSIHNATNASTSTSTTNNTSNQSSNRNTKTNYGTQNKKDMNESKCDDIMIWNPKQRQWSKCCLTLQGTTLSCANNSNNNNNKNASIIWNVLLDSYCTIERVRNPTRLEDLAKDSSDEDEVDSSNNSLKKVSKKSSASTLYCLNVSKFEDNEPETLPTFQHIFATSSVLDCDEWKIKIQMVVDQAMESELDQLMIFADSDGPPKSKSMLSSIASKARSVLSRGREKRVSKCFLVLFHLRYV